ncbi:uncharacterized protein LOC121668380 [Corvus kubaryi]|uniref:uncharacterized protein LOC121668380 n=1 Tax=Corvus kubaryi TaxID=68294 RepID=UPI001C0406F5|nr:uncharacterized protein LOC121668380 [Corvus kubaryi]
MSYCCRRRIEVLVAAFESRRQQCPASPTPFKKKPLLFLFPCLSDARPEPREKSLSAGLPGLLQAGPGGRQAILRLLLLLIFLLLLLLRHRPRPAPGTAAPPGGRARRRANPAPRKSSAEQIQRRANPAQSKSSAEQIHSNPGAARHSAASAPQWQNLGNFRAVPAAGSFPVPGRSRGEVTCLELQGLVHGSDCHKAGESMSQPAKKIYVQYTSICGQHEKSSCDRKTKVCLKVVQKGETLKTWSSMLLGRTIT